MKWQRARFADRGKESGDSETFWVIAEAPKEGALPELNDARNGFDPATKVHGYWYQTNVLEPNGRFCMWAPQNAVELLPEFADDVSEDDRFLLP